MNNMDLLDMKLFLGVTWPGLEVPLPCVYCHFESNARVSIRKLLQVCTHVECVVLCDGRMLPDAQLRVRGIGRICDGNETTTELEFFHAYVLVEHGYSQEFLTAISERSRWSMFILCDEEEQVIHFSITQHGLVTARSFIKREQLSFIRDPNIRLQ